MLLTDARRRARVGPDGELIPLDRQDRTLWDRELILEGTARMQAAHLNADPGQSRDA
jgi:predicted RNA polymerase sigma factor